jgi:TolA-binding protein
VSETFDELSARARRGELSRPEQQRLDTFLKASFEARVWHESGRQFDAEDRVQPGDHAAVERVMQRMLAAKAMTPAPRNVVRRRFAVLLVAAAAFGASASAASLQGVRWWRVHQAHELEVATPVTQKVAPRAVVTAPVVAAPGRQPSAEAAAPLVPSAVVPAPAVPRSSPTPSTRDGGNDAAALFSAAALARREGNAAKAIALLDGLQQRFPGSREARSSDMTLGSLHLQRGASAAALEHFGRYLRAAPRGELASEALWGEAQALTALGRRGEAEARLRQLVERFPGSPYAAAARVKLELAAP